ncbi:MAG: hypothetical protein IRZ11_07525 [Clostridia bacterium]|nr:hypothetical protein [Clostridia bacterium]
MRGRLWRRALALAALFSLALTSVSWAVGLSLPLTIPVLSTPHVGASSSPVAVTPVGGTVVLPGKKAHREAGVELYRVEVGDAGLSDQLLFHIGLLNPQVMSGVLKKGWIEVGLYHQVSSGEDYVLPAEGGIKVKRISGSRTHGRLRKEDADLLLRPGIAGDSTIYVVVSVVNSAGNIPPGQQNVDDLEFFLDVRLR